MNADPDVRVVIHVGDIHSGKQYCTDAYDRSVAACGPASATPRLHAGRQRVGRLPQGRPRAAAPTTRTPGQIDYKTDPVTGEPIDYAGGYPTANLDLIRSIFFANPATTLGGDTLPVLSQAQLPILRHPADATTSRTCLWAQAASLFVTLNIPGGSNNDADPWYGAPTTAPPQTPEAADRTAADLRWLIWPSRVGRRRRVRRGGGPPSPTCGTWTARPRRIARYEPIIAAPRPAHHRLRRPGAAARRRLARLPLGQPAVPTARPDRRPTRGRGYAPRPNHPGYDVPRLPPDHRARQHVPAGVAQAADQREQ